MSPIGVPCHVLVGALNPNLKTSAAVAQHLTKVGTQAVVGTTGGWGGMGERRGGGRDEGGGDGLA